MPHSPSLHLNLQLLDEGIELIEALDDDDYLRPELRLDSEGIGVHLRHCVDFYSCFLDGLEEGFIDYDQRERDPRVERDRTHALTRLRELRARLQDLDVAALRDELRVRSDLPTSTAPLEASAISSPFRELQFLAHHTIHHYALIAVIVRLRGGELTESFGVAPSTLRYWKETGGRAR